MKTCTKCLEGKPESDFPMMRGKPAACCKACKSAYAKQWNAKPEAKALRYQTMRRWKLDRNYGVTPDEYDRLRSVAGDVCPGCSRPFSAERDACYDHDHETGKYRGFLCRQCNMAVGLLGDDPGTLLALAAYLIQGQDVLGGVE